MLVAGFGSDWLFKGKRIPMIMFYSLGLLVVIPTLWYLPPGYIVIDYFLLSLVGFLIFGPQMLVGLAVAESVDKKAACTANGFAGLFACIGSAVASYPIGCILDTWGWNGYFISLITCTLLVLAIIVKVAIEPKKFITSN